MHTDEKIAVIDRRAGIAEQENTAPQGHTPGALLRIAVERDFPVEKIQQLMDLQERWESTAARKAYVAAMSDLKRDDCPVIVKDRHVAFTNNRGQLVEYDHSSLAQVATQCVHALAKHGFHHDWETRQNAGAVEVTCVVTHRQGHSTKKTLSAAPDQSGSKNQIQALASTVTYLQRYTLLMALGLAPADDDDGRASEAPAGKRAAESQLSPEPSPRAKKAIAVWGRYLGQKNARRKMERMLGALAPEWSDEQYAVLMDVWSAVRGLEGAAEKTKALESAMAHHQAAAKPLGDDEPEHA